MPQAGVDAREQHAQGQAPVALDDPDPDRVVGGAPERHGGRAIAIDDPLHLAEPEGEHLLDVGEDLARPHDASGPVP